MHIPDLREADIERLEKEIDRMSEQLPELKHFVLPGGQAIASACHIVRCVCRRAERICVHMQLEDEFVDDLVIVYLNRLSDYLFVLSRYVLHQHKGIETKWEPRHV
jgi:cob(I)alamin adenosyltransferase